jgi:hypothetical protein
VLTGESLGDAVPAYPKFTKASQILLGLRLASRNGELQEVFLQAVRFSGPDIIAIKKSAKLFSCAPCLPSACSPPAFIGTHQIEQLEGTRDCLVTPRRAAAFVGADGPLDLTANIRHLFDESQTAPCTGRQARVPSGRRHSSPTSV